MMNKQMNEFNKVSTAQKDNEMNVQQQGVLGEMPEDVESVAELMLFDSDVNVYEDNNVRLPDTAEFNIGGKKKKVLSNQDRQKLTEKRRAVIRK